jgi:ABC-type glycerol-3-phosphate transport system permease component
MIGEPRWMPWLTYGVLILGVVIIGFPVWVAIAAATQSIEQVRDVPMSMGVGAEFFNNLRFIRAQAIAQHPSAVWFSIPLLLPWSSQLARL